jgi:ABC-type tungstate transport system permease subunit
MFFCLSDHMAMRYQSAPVGVMPAAAHNSCSLMCVPETFVTTAQTDLAIVAEGDARLLNVLSALPINPRRAADVNEGGTEAFVNWLLDQEAQELIRDFGGAEHGTALFLRRDQIPTTLE